MKYYKNKILHQTAIELNTFVFLISDDFEIRLFYQPVNFLKFYEGEINDTINKNYSKILLTNIFEKGIHIVS